MYNHHPFFQEQPPTPRIVMTYNCTERNATLDQLLTLESNAEKRWALIEFIREENHILRHMAPPQTRSACLTRANVQLNRLPSPALIDLTAIFDEHIGMHP